MKHLKTFENIKSEIYFTINIQNLSPNEIKSIAIKINKMFPTYKFSQDLEFLIDTDPKYLKINYTDYDYIIVHKFYVYLDNVNATINEQELESIDGDLFLKTNSIEELKYNLKVSKNVNKYNL